MLLALAAHGAAALGVLQAGASAATRAHTSPLPPAFPPCRMRSLVVAARSRRHSCGRTPRRVARPCCTLRTLWWTRRRARRSARRATRRSLAPPGARPHCACRCATPLSCRAQSVLRCAALARRAPAPLRGASGAHHACATDRFLVARLLQRPSPPPGVSLAACLHALGRTAEALGTAKTARLAYSKLQARGHQDLWQF